MIPQRKEPFFPPGFRLLAVICLVVVVVLLTWTPNP